MVWHGIPQVSTLDFAAAWWAMGRRDFVCIVPPNATLSPGSTIRPAMCGKAPGMKRGDGTWSGYNWRSAAEPSEEAVRQWALAGANLGMKTDFFPSVDIDCTNAALAARLTQLTHRVLGPAPVRYGARPKALVMYQTALPFPRRRLWLQRGEERHLIEVLGEGQQCIVAGTHPATLLPYEWEQGADTLTSIRAEDIDVLFAAMTEMLQADGWSVDAQSGNAGRSSMSESSLRAPSLEAVQNAVALLPNTNALFPHRDDYIKVGYAIKASLGPEMDEDGYAIFLSWAERWDGGTNHPEMVRGDWRRMRGPYSMGWTWLAEKASDFGYASAVDEFTAQTMEPRDDALTAAVDAAPAPLFGTEHWLAQRVIFLRGSRIRFCKDSGQWYVWTGARYVANGLREVSRLINDTLVAEAQRVSQMGGSVKEQRDFIKKAEGFLTATRMKNVRELMQSDPAIMVEQANFDADPWIINTPQGSIDLKTLQPFAASPSQLSSKMTAVPADFDGGCPVWLQFLRETTGGDAEFEDYLQRLAGYALTGMTTEQQFCFLWGPGGNGKSVFLNVLSGIMGDYCRTAPMEVFMSSRNDRHSTELAMLAGARLVVGSENEIGGSWNEARIKSLTGGEPISARFMRQDNFTFTPQMKLLLSGNARPRIRGVGPAMQRRLHMLPFTHRPERVDMDLGRKLAEEFPAIFAWALRGCVLWQQQGLALPPKAQAATSSYFSEEDLVGAWASEQCDDTDAEAAVASRDLYASYANWCIANHEDPGPIRQFVQKLTSAGIVEATRIYVGDERVRALKGLRLRNADVFAR